MGTVTQVVKATRQPRGGFLKPSLFRTLCNPADEISLVNENVSPALVGLAVDYLTRFVTGASVKEAFDISLRGVTNYTLGICDTDDIDNFVYNAMSTMSKDLDNETIISACKLVSFDVWYRAGYAVAHTSPSYTDIEPNEQTINNIRVMVKRCVEHFKKYGGVVSNGFEIPKHAFTDKITNGDCDFMTETILWDLKVSKNNPTTAHTLQLLIYYLMCEYSGVSDFKDITSIGIFNPRKNAEYVLDIASISKDVIDIVKTEIIGYES